MKYDGTDKYKGFWPALYSNTIIWTILFFCTVFFVIIFEGAIFSKRITLNQHLKIERESNRPSARILLAQIIAVMCYNIDEDRVFVAGCVARNCQNTSENLGNRHVRDQEY